MTGVSQECRYSSNPYHECNEYCNKTNTEVKKSAGKNEGCRYLSNPYHLCNEYCFKIVTGTKKPSRDNKERRSECRYLSNPYHECNEYCVKMIADAKYSSSKNEERRPYCKYSSNPYHVCDEYCFSNADAKKPARINEPDVLKDDTRRSYQLTDDEKSEPDSLKVDTRRRFHLTDDEKSEPDILKADTSTSFQSTEDEKSEPDGLEANTRSFQPILVTTELPNNDDANKKRNEWTILFGEISKLNRRVDQLETYQNEIREEAERRHREIMEKLDLLQQHPPMQHQSGNFL